ncbi:precorrin-3B C(17)-methyltransferase [uncultured Desulfobacter sp.]|uniref:precorrin-3B C(17)-methyltransferase n=1 Tax=uncultured Desulfobacter sp. TaxID=240139 RepID=UPI0029F580D9|nr:precorrin-3B C(17)-methyltransferase [uncultured Desulfobacter sp.]
MRSSSHAGNGQDESVGEENSQSDSHHCPGGNTLYIVGTGPGHVDHMSGRARQVLAACDIVVGYNTYLELIEDVIRDKKRLTTGMTKEMDRVQAAIDAALGGQVCALVSGGDAGIYAMAGLVLEMLAVKKIACNTGAKDSLAVEVVPGIPALAAGAALLGAPLTHDFATVSLSDLLTPWEMIEKRLDAAASADFVINIYNPKSKKRDWQLSRAMEIVLKHRAGTTPVGIVTGAMRDNQKIALCALNDLDKADVGMQSIVIVGNSSTFIYNDLMITPRGYSQKYDI